MTITIINYLESTGTQYIDTGIAPKISTRVVFSFSFTDLNDSQVRNGWQSSSYKENYMWGYKNGQFYSGVSENTTSNFSEIPLDANKHLLILQSGMQKIDDDIYGSTKLINDFSATKTLYLFATHVEWNPYVSNYCKEKIYSTKIYDGNTLVRDYIPVLDSSNRPCLFDKVEKTCYYNQGTGEFLYG